MTQHSSTVGTGAVDLNAILREIRGLHVEINAIITDMNAMSADIEASRTDKSVQSPGLNQASNLFKMNKNSAHRATPWFICDMGVFNIMIQSTSNRSGCWAVLSMSWSFNQRHSGYAQIDIWRRSE